MKQLKHLMVFTFLLVFLVHMAKAQGQLNVTFITSFNYPLKDLGTTELKKGGVFKATHSYRFIPCFAAYSGWSWNTFNQRTNKFNCYGKET